MRRLAHLALLLLLVAGVRACGGLTVVGDRLSSTSREVGERTGVKALHDKVKRDVAPQITGAVRRAGKKGQQAASDALERAAEDIGKK